MHQFRYKRKKLRLASFLLKLEIFSHPFFGKYNRFTVWNARLLLANSNNVKSDSLQIMLHSMWGVFILSNINCIYNVLH